MTPEEIAYLRQAAARDGYNPDDALKVFQHESSGRTNIWGGKGGNYFGIFQAGPSERAQFGVDTQHPSAQNQIDAFGKFLHARGFKPGMGLMDMYSTVLAGSPGHYGRSDGNGTVAQHVANMVSGVTPTSAHSVVTPSHNPYGFALDALPAGYEQAQSETSTEEPKEDMGETSRKSLMSSLATLTNKQQPLIDTTAQNRAFEDFANQQHQQALGLLASNQRGLLGA